MLVDALIEQKQVQPDASVSTMRRWAFGMLIGNTSTCTMAIYRLSVSMADHMRLRLLYDILPMGFAPKVGENSQHTATITLMDQP